MKLSEGGLQCVAQRSDFVLNRERRRNHVPRNQTVAFQAAKALGQSLLGNTFQPSFDSVEAMGAIVQNR